MTFEIVLPKRCLNCDRGADEVEALVAGLGIYLCGSCALEMAASARSADATASGSTDGDVRCGFCGKRRDAVEYAAVGMVRDFLVCGECLELVGEMVADAVPQLPE